MSVDATVFKKVNTYILSLAFLLFLSVNLTAYSADDIVSYAGIYTTGKGKEGNNFQNFYRNQTKIVSGFRDTFEKLNSENKLPFELLMETDSEQMKNQLNENPYSLAVVITRDDINNEKFEYSESDILLNKTYINIGMVVILYQTLADQKQIGKNKSSIVFSLPIVGYSTSLSGKNGLSASDLDNEFVRLAKATLEEEVIKRLQKVSIGTLKGKVSKVENNKAFINIGSLSGLSKDQYVKFIDSEKAFYRGKVESLSADQAIIALGSGSEKVKTGTDIQASNIKGLSDETYQVTGFKISSEKCKKWLDEETVGAQASQWFSDYLSERGGKIVFPSKIGGTWIEGANEQSFAIFIKDGQEHMFEVAKPKYQVTLDITGLSDKKIEEESNEINENWMFKLWLKVEMPEKQYSKEFDMVTNKSILVGAQSFEEKSEVFELLHQLTAKAAKEVE